ncbi:MAG: Uma2 family endonuclease [Tepidisphaeraceae bacterium]
MLENVSWETYERLLDEVHRQHVYLTYDRGRLQIMPPSLPLHERTGRFLERIVHTFTEMRNIPICSLGSTTWKRRDVDAGLEADNCYYLREHEAIVRHLDRIDLSQVPPPDLAIEVDVSSQSLDKIAVYQRLSIPEIWRCEENRLVVQTLGAKGYESASASRALPDLPLKQVQSLLDARLTIGELECIRALRKWVEDSFPS